MRDNGTHWWQIPRIWTILATSLILMSACSSGGGQDDSAVTSSDSEGSSTAPSDPEDAVPWPDLTGSDLRFSTSGWSTNFSRTSVKLSEIESGGPGKDGIPPIDNPNFVTTAEADEFLAPDEPVMMLRVGDDVRAYPLQILIWHEIVNDIVAGEPVVVTYCPLCNTAIAFRSTVEGRVLDFGTTGNLRHSDLVMYDRQTESWWQQITGEAIVGELVGTTLDFVPAGIVAYSDFKASAPEGRVLSLQTGHERPYGSNPYVGYDTGTPFLFSGDVDTRLRSTERVVAVVVDAEAAAYPFQVLEEERVVNDVVGGRPLVVLFKPGARSSLDTETIRDSRQVGAGVVFDRRVGERTLTFLAAGDFAADIETGSQWDITGRAVQGPLAGTRLEPVTHGNHFWFAWAVFRPDTHVYEGHD